MGRPVLVQTIQRPGPDEAFHGLPVHNAHIDIVDELEDVLRQAFFLPALDDVFDGIFTHVFHTQQAEPDLSV